MGSAGFVPGSEELTTGVSPAVGCRSADCSSLLPASGSTTGAVATAVSSAGAGSAVAESWDSVATAGGSTTTSGASASAAGASGSAAGGSAGASTAACAILARRASSCALVKQVCAPVSSETQSWRVLSCCVVNELAN